MFRAAFSSRPHMYVQDGHLNVSLAPILLCRAPQAPQVLVVYSSPTTHTSFPNICDRATSAWRNAKCRSPSSARAALLLSLRTIPSGRLRFRVTWKSEAHAYIAKATSGDDRLLLAQFILSHDEGAEKKDVMVKRYGGAEDDGTGWITADIRHMGNGMIQVTATGLSSLQAHNSFEDDWKSIAMQDAIVLTDRSIARWQARQVPPSKLQEQDRKSRQKQAAAASAAFQPAFLAAFLATKIYEMGQR